MIGLGKPPTSYERPDPDTGDFQILSTDPVAPYPNVMAVQKRPNFPIKHDVVNLDADWWSRGFRYKFRHEGV